jgi:uncharacterized protein (DUF983 family)
MRYTRQRQLKQLDDEEIAKTSGGVIPDGNSDDWPPWDRDIIYYCPNCEDHDLGHRIRNRKYRLRCNTCGNTYWESQSKGHTVSGKL